MCHELTLARGGGGGQETSVSEVDRLPPRSCRCAFVAELSSFQSPLSWRRSDLLSAGPRAPLPVLASVRHGERGLALKRPRARQRGLELPVSVGVRYRQQCPSWGGLLLCGPPFFSLKTYRRTGWLWGSDENARALE